jgi:hypothetical protein
MITKLKQMLHDHNKLFCKTLRKTTKSFMRVVKFLGPNTLLQKEK